MHVKEVYVSKIIKWFKCQMVWEHEGRPEVVGFCILAFLQDFFFLEKLVRNFFCHDK